ncbi:MAG: ABC transporter permease subunit [Roseburia sp.]|nr:ABC transporter permease subunit [Roseburia sp.]
MSDILYCEWLKLKRSKVTVIGFFGALFVPVFVILNQIQLSLKNPDRVIGFFELFSSMIMFLMLLFAPLVLSIFAVYLVSREYTEKTLKTVFSVPVSRTKFLVGKFLILYIIVLLFMFLSWLDLLILTLLSSFFVNVESAATLPTVLYLFMMLFKILCGGTLLYMTVTPVIYLSIRNKGFVAPFIVVATVCLLNVVLSNSGVAGFIPWSASYLLITGRSGNFGCPPWVSFLIIVLICALSVAASMKRFLNEDIL